MHDCLSKQHILIILFKLHIMMNMHTKYDNMHKNGIFYVLFRINIHIIKSISCMLSTHTLKISVNSFLIMTNQKSNTNMVRKN